MYLAREGMPPDRPLSQGRTELTGYGGQIITGTVVAAERLDDGDLPPRARGRIRRTGGPPAGDHRPDR
jgi:hypothetical protein